MNRTYTAVRNGTVFCPAGKRTQSQGVTISWDGVSKMAKVVDYQRRYNGSKRQSGIFATPSERVRISAIWDIRSNNDFTIKKWRQKNDSGQC